jgi:hypothetical protein
LDGVSLAPIMCMLLWRVGFEGRAKPSPEPFQSGAA